MRLVRFAHNHGIFSGSGRILLTLPFLEWKRSTFSLATFLKRVVVFMCALADLYCQNPFSKLIAVELCELLLSRGRDVATHYGHFWKFLSENSVLNFNPGSLNFAVIEKIVECGESS